MEGLGFKPKAILHCFLILRFSDCCIHPDTAYGASILYVGILPRRQWVFRKSRGIEHHPIWVFLQARQDCRAYQTQQVLF